MKERVFLEEFDSLYFFKGSTQNWCMQDFHFHKQYEIILFLSDGATFEVDNRFYNVKSGDLFLINGKEYHRTNGALGKLHNRYVLMFDPALLRDMSKVFEYDFERYFDNRPDNFIHRIHLSGIHLSKVEKMMEKIEKSIAEEKGTKEKVKIKLAILELLLSVNEMYEFFMHDIELEHEKFRQQKSQYKSVEFKEPVLYRERIEKKKKKKKKAGTFYLSRYYLSHYFKKETGFTVVQYITNQKIIAAKKLLKSGLMVTEVAEKLAYNSDSHFISIFKKTTGITPKQYAKKEMKSDEEEK